VSTTPKELIDCATAMSQSATDEAAYRAVCSRAYYGAFHAAKAFHDALPSPGTVGSARGRHEQLISQLSNPTVSSKNKKHGKSVAIGKTLRSLVTTRVLADYTITAAVDKATATSAAQNAVVLHTAATT